MRHCRPPVDAPRIHRGLRFTDCLIGEPQPRFTDRVDECVGTRPDTPGEPGVSGRVQRRPTLSRTRTDTLASVPRPGHLARVDRAYLACNNSARPVYLAGPDSDLIARLDPVTGPQSAFARSTPGETRSQPGSEPPGRCVALSFLARRSGGFRRLALPLGAGADTAVAPLSFCFGRFAVGPAGLDALCDCNTREVQRRSGAGRHDPSLKAQIARGKKGVEPAARRSRFGNGRSERQVDRRAADLRQCGAAALRSDVLRNSTARDGQTRRETGAFRPWGGGFCRQAQCGAGRGAGGATCPTVSLSGCRSTKGSTPAAIKVCQRGSAVRLIWRWSTRPRSDPRDGRSVRSERAPAPLVRFAAPGTRRSPCGATAGAGLVMSLETRGHGVQSLSFISWSYPVIMSLLALSLGHVMSLGDEGT